MKPKAVKPQARVNDLRATPFAHICCSTNAPARC
jgi:hypothetical protein